MKNRRSPKKTSGFHPYSIAAVVVILFGGYMAWCWDASLRIDNEATRKFITERLTKMRKPGSAKQISETVEIVAAIDTASEKHRIPKALLFAIMEKESRGDITAKRYEPKVAARLPKTPDRDNLASSYGLMQVMGYHAKFCGLNSYKDLYVPEKNLDCASKLLRQNLMKLTPRKALVAYNGTGPQAEAYANSIIESWRKSELRS